MDQSKVIVSNSFKMTLHAQHLPYTQRYLSTPSPKIHGLLIVDNLHLNHVELPYVLDLAVHPKIG